MNEARKVVKALRVNNEAGYTKEHFLGWKARYEEVAAATTGKATKTPQYRAELMQRFIDAWD